MTFYIIVLLCIREVLTTRQLNCQPTTPFASTNILLSTHQFKFEDNSPNTGNRILSSASRHFTTADVLPGQKETLAKQSPSRNRTSLDIIHIRTRHVSFSILIGRNSVAEWLIVASTYYLNSDPKWPALLIPMSVWLWLQSVLHTKCGLCPVSPSSLRFMISLILSQKLWINSILELFFTAALWILVI